MPENICLAQDVKELKYILKNTSEKLTCVPLSLETHLYCISVNLNFIDPINLIDNQFHKESLIETEKFVNNVNCTKPVDSNIKIEIRAFLRFRLNSIIFLIELLNKINEKYIINKIYISGWNVNNHTIHAYILNDILNFLFSNYEKIKISKKDFNFKEQDLYSYDANSSVSSKKNILVSNLNYNFKRIIFSARKNNYKLYIPNFSKISFFKKFLYQILNLGVINFKNIDYKEKEIELVSEIFFKYKKLDLSDLLNLLKNKLNRYFLDLEQKNIALKNFLKKNNFSLALTNTARGIDASVVASLKNKDWSTVCISHGTIAERFNVYDELYKKIIAETVFSGDSQYFAIQSKIANKAINTHRVNGKNLTTGNLLFSQAKTTSKRNKKYILFAVTIKEFCNFQFLGVEMYYEFIQNLRLFETITKENNLNFIIKVHPAENRCIKMLQEIFPSLIFSKKKIEYLLKKSFVAISFSSTAIEDSLNSYVPVILFDQWRRYQHCEAEVDFFKTGEAIYYVNNKEDLIKCINNIQKCKKFNFEKYIYPENFEDNIKNNLFSLIK